MMWIAAIWHFKSVAATVFEILFLKTKPVLLEPVMKLEAEVPPEFQGQVAGELSSRRGIIVSTDRTAETSIIEAEVPLAETFGYSNRPAEHDPGPRYL